MLSAPERGIWQKAQQTTGVEKKNAAQSSSMNSSCQGMMKQHQKMMDEMQQMDKQLQKMATPTVINMEAAITGPIASLLAF